MTNNLHGWPDAVFAVGLALLIGHELDAVAHHEWRLLPMLDLLSDDLGRVVFVLCHVPLLAVLFWLTGHRSERLRHRSRLGVDFFLILHGGLHVLYSGHESYAFDAPVSILLIFGGSAIGLVHVVLMMRRRSRGTE